MTVGVYHAFTSTKALGTTQVTAWSDDWDADHYHAAFLVQQIVGRGGASAGWAMPNARTEFLGKTMHRWRYDMTYVDALRFTVGVLNSVTLIAPRLLVQWSGDGGATWSMPAADGSNALNASLKLKGTISSGWISTSAAMKAAGDVLMRIAGENGDGATVFKVGALQLHAM